MSSGQQLQKSLIFMNQLARD